MAVLMFRLDEKVVMALIRNSHARMLSLPIFATSRARCDSRSSGRTPRRANRAPAYSTDVCARITSWPSSDRQPRPASRNPSRDLDGTQEAALNAGRPRIRSERPRRRCDAPVSAPPCCTSPIRPSARCPMTMPFPPPRPLKPSSSRSWARHHCNSFRCWPRIGERNLW